MPARGWHKGRGGSGRIEGEERVRDLSPPRGRRGSAASREAMSVTSGNYARVPVAIGLLILLGARWVRSLLAPRTRRSRSHTTRCSPVAGSGRGWEWTFRRRSWFQWGDTTTDWSTVDDGYAIADRCVCWPREGLSLCLISWSLSDFLGLSSWSSLLVVAITLALISRIRVDKGIFDDRRGALDVSASLVFVG